jgi:release factor glutamine methyltransferase
MIKYNDLYRLSLEYQKNNISRLELEVLLCHVLQIDRSTLKAYPDKIIPQDKLTDFYQVVNRRINNEPMAYIVGYKNFWDLELLITKDVLIPRADTETLVEQAFKILSELSKKQFASKIKILELGTGSGAIALAIAKHHPNCEIIATDINLSALHIAQYNANKLNIHNIKFLLGDWFAALANDHNYINYKFDIIISNPPYISSDEINLCDPEIFFEPQNALFAPDHGMACLKNIIVNCKQYLTGNGYLLLEHGINQSPQLMQFMLANNFTKVQSIKDLSDNNRVLIANFIANLVKDSSR